MRRDGGRQEQQQREVGDDEQILVHGAHRGDPGRARGPRAEPDPVRRAAARIPARDAPQPPEHGQREQSRADFARGREDLQVVVVRRARGVDHRVGLQHALRAIRRVHAVERPEPGPPDAVGAPHRERRAPDEEPADAGILLRRGDALGSCADVRERDHARGGDQGDEQHDGPGAAPHRPRQDRARHDEDREAHVAAARVGDDQPEDFHAEGEQRHGAPSQGRGHREHGGPGDAHEQERREQVGAPQRAVGARPNQLGERPAEPVRRGRRAARVLPEPDERLPERHRGEPGDEHVGLDPVIQGHEHGEHEHGERDVKSRFLARPVGERRVLKREERHDGHRGHADQRRPGQHAPTRQPAQHRGRAEPHGAALEYEKRGPVLEVARRRQERQPARGRPPQERDRPEQDGPVQDLAERRVEPGRSVRPAVGGYELSHAS